MGKEDVRALCTCWGDPQLVAVGTGLWRGVRGCMLVCSVGARVQVVRALIEGNRGITDTSSTSFYGLRTMRINLVFFAAWLSCLWVGSSAQAPGKKVAPSCPSPLASTDELKPCESYTGVPGTATERSFFVSSPRVRQRGAIAKKTAHKGGMGGEG